VSAADGPSRPTRAFLVDPSLFTAPYDAALTEGLVAAGVEPTWAVRPTRAGDRQEIAREYVDDFFYRRTDALALPGPLRASCKGIAHALGLGRLARLVRARKPDVVHFQWAVLPLLDTAAIAWIRRSCPVVLTVHDTTPINGDRLSSLQKLAFDLPARLADKVIVHTQAGRRALLARGFPSSKVSVIAHGPLRLQTKATPARRARDSRWTLVLFGEIKPYKGVDVLIEAVAQLPASVREQARFIVAGRPRMDLAPLDERLKVLGLGAAVEIRPGRLSEDELAELFEEADCFLFPYRQIDASGAYFLVKALGKWVIASRVGIFAEDVQDGVTGTLVPPDDPRALAAALGDAILARLEPAAVDCEHDWTAIGWQTRALYHDAHRRFLAQRGARRRVRALVSDP
jgi:glycosyltransferase involved in cell wall biosynthesis